MYTVITTQGIKPDPMKEIEITEMANPVEEAEIRPFSIQ